MNRTLVPSALVAVAVALATTPNFAAPPSAVKAAAAATRAAKAATFALLDRGGSINRGTVTLQRIGSTRSRIRVQLANPATTGTRVTLRSGSDCQSPRIANAPHQILLNPFTGRVSETIVSLPLTNLRSGNYLVHVQNATAREQFIDACARLNQQ